MTPSCNLLYLVLYCAALAAWVLGTLWAIHLGHITRNSNEDTEVDDSDSDSEEEDDDEYHYYHNVISSKPFCLRWNAGKRGTMNFDLRYPGAPGRLLFDNPYPTIFVFCNTEIRPLADLSYCIVADSYEERVVLAKTDEPMDENRYRKHFINTAEYTIADAEDSRMLVFPHPYEMEDPIPIVFKHIEKWQITKAKGWTLSYIDE